jgi:hypothetical protein
VLWLLQPGLALKDLRERFTPFMNDGIVYRGVVLRLGSDRSDGYLHNDGSPEQVKRRREEYRSMRLREIDIQIEHLRNDREQIRNGAF